MTELQSGARVMNIIRGPEPQVKYFPEAKGHEKILATCKKHSAEVFIKMMDGNVLSGEITQFDRWTITIKLDSGNRRTVFKHAMQYFEGKQ